MRVPFLRILLSIVPVVLMVLVGVVHAGDVEVRRRSMSERSGLVPRATTRLEREVDNLLRQLGGRNGQVRSMAQNGFRRLDATAVPRLKQHVDSTTVSMRLLALAALQYAWSPEAEGILKVAEGDANPKVRAVALAVQKKRGIGRDVGE